MPKLVKDDLTLDHLESISETFSRMAESLKAEIAAVRVSGFKSLSVRNLKTCERSMREFQAFVAAVATSHVEACKERGDFGAAFGKLSRKKAAKKSR